MQRIHWEDIWELYLYWSKGSRTEQKEILTHWGLSWWSRAGVALESCPIMRLGDKAFAFLHSVNHWLQVALEGEHYLDKDVSCGQGEFQRRTLILAILSQYSQQLREVGSGWDTTVSITVHPFCCSNPLASTVNSYHLGTVPPGFWSVLFSGKLNGEGLAGTNLCELLQFTRGYNGNSLSPFSPYLQIPLTLTSTSAGLDDLPGGLVWMKIPEESKFLDSYSMLPSGSSYSLCLPTFIVGHEKTRRWPKWITWNTNLFFPAPIV